MDANNSMKSFSVKSDTGYHITQKNHYHSILSSGLDVTKSLVYKMFTGSYEMIVIPKSVHFTKDPVDFLNGDEEFYYLVEKGEAILFSFDLSILGNDYHSDPELLDVDAWYTFKSIPAEALTYEGIIIPVLKRGPSPYFDAVSSINLINKIPA